MVRLVGKTTSTRLELLSGAVSVVLAILGLAGVFATSFVQIAAAATGLALLAYGGEMMGRVMDLAGRLSEEEAKRLRDLGLNGGGEYASAQAAGISGVILGILAILGVGAGTLPAVVAIILGAALAYSAGSVSRLLALTLEVTNLSPIAKVVAQERISSAIGGYVLAGIASVALGILALVLTEQAVVLTLVAFLVLGFSLLGGSILSTAS